uniref:Uncharacterized protein LOC105058736 n=1 Tax=Elaeis guineensis var. tenera TaxID=51953 RepID=A0A8N4FDR5_ELAGV|nr:uncharacterized protein LOC105058736 [Elaeis guineensis]
MVVRHGMIKKEMVERGVGCSHGGDSETGTAIFGGPPLLGGCRTPRQAPPVSRHATILVGRAARLCVAATKGCPNKRCPNFFLAKFESKSARHHLNGKIRRRRRRRNKASKNSPTVGIWMWRKRSGKLVAKQ